jgi:hypothetical protein
MRVEILTTVTTNITVLWGVTPCNLVEFIDVSEEFFASIFKLEDLKMEAARSSKTSANIYQIIWRHIPD